jgi:hypothetical protein
MPNVAKLIEVMEKARTLVNRPDGDFTWSSWIDEDHATRELDDLLRKLRVGDQPYGAGTGILFAPTGPMQELALSSGWGDEFNALADRYDEAMSEEVCECLNRRRRDLVHLADLGVDRRHGESSVLACPDCGQNWVHYLYEEEAFTGSGRWFESPIPIESRATLTADNAIDLINAQPWHYYGGSYFGHEGRSSGVAMR